GLIPGWGGTQRLPRLIGIDRAIEIICGGDSIPAAKAVDLGLAWSMVPAASLHDEAKRVIHFARTSGDWQGDRQRLSSPMGLSNDNLIFNREVARSFILAQTKGHYPAPIAALEAILEGCNLPLEAGMRKETEKFLPLLGSDINQNLILLFF